MDSHRTSLRRYSTNSEDGVPGGFWRCSCHEGGKEHVREQELDQIGPVRYGGGTDVHVIVNESEDDELDEALRHPRDTALIQREGIFAEVVACERLVIDDREEREAHVREHEEVRERPRPIRLPLRRG